MQNTAKRTVACISVLVLFTIILLIHTAYSFCYSDESFYVSLAHRLYLGEALIADEWHPVQFYSLILYPFYVLYKLFVPTGAGVIRFFRILYVLFAAAVSIAFFLRLKKDYDTCISFLSAMLILLYSRANISGCSYYNLFFLGSLTFFLLTERAICTKKIPAAPLAGFALAPTILCNPYFLIPVSVGWCIAFVADRNGKVRSSLIWILAACVVTGAAYVGFLLSRSAFAEILKNLPYVTQDPGHQNSILAMLRAFWNEASYVLNPTLYLPWAIMIIAVIVEHGGHKRSYKNSALHLMIYLPCVAVFLVQSVVRSTDSVVDSISYPCTVVFSPLFLRALLSKKYSMPVYLYVLGLAGAFSFFLGSNTGLDATTVGLTICTTAGFLLTGTWLRGISAAQKKEGAACKVLLILLTCTVVAVFGSHRLIGLYRDAPIKNLTVQIGSGPAAGLKTTPEHAREYQSIYDSIQKIQQDYPETSVMFARTIPWTYLCTNWEYGSPSAWANVIAQDRLRIYYQLHPNKVPELVFLFQPNVGSYETVLFNNHKKNNDFNSNPLEGWFWETHLKNAAIILENEYVTVYRLKK